MDQEESRETGRSVASDGLAAVAIALLAIGLIVFVVASLV